MPKIVEVSNLNGTKNVIVDGSLELSIPAPIYGDLTSLYKECFGAPELWYEFDKCFKSSTQVILGLYDDSDSEIVSTATGLLMPSMLHGGRPRMQIENVCTTKSCRKRGYASLLIERLIEIAEEYDCHKVSLSCSDKNLPFYKCVGFREYEHSMRMDLNV